MSTPAEKIVSPVWSTYQNAAFVAVTQGSGNFIIRAGAGSGKTTTGVEMVKRRPAGSSHVFLAFNKAIATELAARGVNGKTFHSLCFNPVTRAKNSRDVNSNKVRQIVANEMTVTEVKLYGAFVTRLVGLAKNAGVGALVDDTEQAWDDLASRHDLELDHEEANYATAIEWARRILQVSNAAFDLDFDDLLYLAVKDGLVLPKFDFVFVDEYQDTNAIQRAIIRKIMHAGSRLFMIGDQSQAIYGFRGADSDSMEQGAKEFNAQWLPLTVTYRCARAIVAYAHQFGEIEAAPGAPEGIVRTARDGKFIPDLRPQDLVVSRTAKPLIELAYQLLKARIPAYVMGREIGQGLKSLILKQNARGIEALIAKLNAYTQREVEKAIAKNQEAKAEAIQDKTDCVLFLIDSMLETDRTIPALLATIDDLFSDKSHAVILATIHKSKGLEANRVFWLNSDYMSKYARQEWQKQQEVNLQYVAATRAKSELVLIPSQKR